MSIDFNKTAPWCDIKEVEVEGQSMVWIPKFYFRRANVVLDADRMQHTCWWISSKMEEGFKVHPAFMHKGVETDGFYIGAYEMSQDGDKAASKSDVTPWVKVTPAATYQTKAKNRGEEWHAENIYEVSAINMLLMIELGSTDEETKIAFGNHANTLLQCGKSNAVWRGIHEWWGNCWEYVDGLKFDASNQLLVYDNKGNETFVETKITMPRWTSGWQSIIETYDTVGENFDLSGCFIASKVGAAGSGNFAAGVHDSGIASPTSYRGSCKGDTDKNFTGAFSWYRNPTAANDETTSRLARYGDVPIPAKTETPAEGGKKA